MTQFIVEADLLQRVERNNRAARYLCRLIEELGRAGALGAVLFDPFLGPPGISLDVPAGTWCPNTRRELRRLSRLHSPIYLVTSWFGPYAPTWPQTRLRDLMPLAVLVHHTSQLNVLRSKPAHAGQTAAQLAAVPDVDVVVTTSDQARDALLELAAGLDPEKIINIGPALPRGFARGTRSTSIAWQVHRAFPDINRPYVLCQFDGPCASDLGSVASAWELLPDGIRRRHNLVMVGRGGQPGTQESVRASRSERSGIVLIATDRPDDLDVLYRGASLVVIPSDACGDGHWPFTAVASGQPALISAQSALAEQTPRQAIIGLEQPTSDATVLENALMTNAPAHTTTLDRLASQEHWQEHLRRLHDAARSTSRSPRRTTPTSRRAARIAIAGPFSPARTGVGVYNTRLAHHLAKFAELDCFVDGDWSNADVGEADAYPIAALGDSRSTNDYDLVVAVLGNSEFHVAAYAALKRTRCVAWLHDVNLTGLHSVRGRAESHDRPLEFMKQMFNTCYGAQARKPTSFVNHDEIAREGFYMAAEVGREAAATIVSSQLAAELLALDACGALPAPSFVLPLGFPDVHTPSERSNAARGPVIVSMGNLYDLKRPFTLVDAVAAMPQSMRPRVVFAGENHLRDPAAFDRHVKNLGLAELVEVTGWIPEVEYWERLSEARLVVQLREMSSGESSATVVDAMSMGRVVVTSVASCAGFPPGVHVQVAEDIDPQGLADVLERYLGNPTALATTEESALSYARSWGFDQVAHALIEIAGV